MFYRKITPILESTVSSFPVTVLTGPRQSGKTTLIRHLFPLHEYFSLESPDNLLLIKNDPRGILSAKKQWFLDEVQNFPQIFSFLQEIVDEQPSRGRFILSGSQNLLLSKYISQSLAGRAAILELLPLSFDEYWSHKELKKEKTLWDFLWHGSYPRPYQEHLDHALWYQSYMRTYLERDVRSLSNVKDLSLFQVFIKLCAGRHGQLLNLSSLASDCGISQTTASEWLSILEASYIVYRLRPYFKNYSKRLVKTPKLYFYDSALVCLSLGIENPTHLQLHASKGAIFEGFIIAEAIKHFLSLGKSPFVYFWRDHLGIEVDLIVERGESLYAMEIKASETYNPFMTQELKKWLNISKLQAQNTFCIYAGKQALQGEINIINWQEFNNLLQKKIFK